MLMGYSSLSPGGMKLVTQRAAESYFSGEKSSIPGLFRVISRVLQNKS